jgi:hypothetical protein
MASKDSKPNSQPDPSDQKDTCSTCKWCNSVFTSNATELPKPVGGPTAGPASALLCVPCLDASKYAMSSDWGDAWENPTSMPIEVSGTDPKSEFGFFAWDPADPKYILVAPMPADQDEALSQTPQVTYKIDLSTVPPTIVACEKK